MALAGRVRDVNGPEGLSPRAARAAVSARAGGPAPQRPLSWRTGASASRRTLGRRPGHAAAAPASGTIPRSGRARESAAAPEWSRWRVSARSRCGVRRVESRTQRRDVACRTGYRSTRRTRAMRRSRPRPATRLHDVDQLRIPVTRRSAHAMTGSRADRSQTFASGSCSAVAEQLAQMLSLVAPRSVVHASDARGGNRRSGAGACAGHPPVSSVGWTRPRPCRETPVGPTALRAARRGRRRRRRARSRAVIGDQSGSSAARSRAPISSAAPLTRAQRCGRPPLTKPPGRPPC